MQGGRGHWELVSKKWLVTRVGGELGGLREKKKKGVFVMMECGGYKNNKQRNKKFQGNNFIKLMILKKNIQNIKNLKYE